MIRTGDPQTDALLRCHAERKRDEIYIRRKDLGDPFWEFVRDRQDRGRHLRTAFVQLLDQERVITDRRYVRLLLDYLLIAYGFTEDCLPVEFVDSDGRPVAV